MQKRFLIIASLMGGVSVAIGAFAAHSLKPQLTDYQIGIFETGVDYQFFHTFAIFMVVLLADKLPRKALNTVGWLFTVGILFFSGSLYLLACKDILGVAVGFLGPITPIGGTLFIVGWGILLWNAIKMKAS